jgi:hypothetical protein
VLSIICNTICLQFSLYPFAEFGFVFIDFITYFRLELYWLYFFRKKTDMKFIILVSNLKEVPPSVFSWKKRIYKKPMQFYCQNMIRSKKYTKLCLRVGKCTKLFVDEGNVHMAQDESWKNKNIDGFYAKTIQKGGFSNNF